MNHEFLIKTRRACANLGKVTAATTLELVKLRFKLAKDAEAIILHDRVTGKAFLTSNLNELLIEEPYVEMKVKARLEELRGEGLDDYDAVYANTKDVALTTTDAISELLQLFRIYYPDELGTFEVLLRRYLPFDITNRWQGENLRVEKYFDDSRSNEETFLSKIIPNPASRKRFDTLDELITSMMKQVEFEFNKYSDSVKAQIETFPTAKMQVINRELEDAMKDYKSIAHGMLLIDSVLRDPIKFEKAFKELAHTIDHLSSDDLTNVCHLTIKRATLLRKIDFLNASISARSLMMPTPVLDRSECEVDNARVEVRATREGMTELVNKVLQPLSGSWRKRPKNRPELYLQVVKDVSFLISNEKMPDSINKVGKTGFPVDFIRRTFSILHDEVFPKRSPESRKLLIRYIHAAFEQFANVTESTTTKKFVQYQSDYDRDRREVTY